MAADFKALGKNTQGALIAGAVALVISFFESYVTVDIAGFSVGTNAWTSFATLGMLLILVATALVAVKAFAAQSLPDGAPWNLITAAAAGLGTVLVILRAITADGPAGPGWSGFVLFIAGIALTVFTVLDFKSSGEQIPDFKGDGNTPAA